eukprot:5447718-Pleurochrysis_carterae.AAC.1
MLRQFSYYGECVASDLSEMPTSPPFGYGFDMLCFYDLATKYLETFFADNNRYVSGRRAVTWLTGNGSKFFEKNLDAFLSRVCDPPEVHRALQPAD